MRRDIPIVLLVWLLAAGAAWTDDPDEPPEPRDPERQLGRLRAGLAFKAREEEREVLKAAHLYLQAAQAFHQAGDDEYRKALVAGTLAARFLRATWLHDGQVVAMTFLPGDREVVTCAVGGDVHVWDAVTGREVRSFRIKDTLESGTSLDGAVFNADSSRLLAWAWNTFQLWDVNAGKLLQTWDWGPRLAGGLFLRDGKRVLLWNTDDRTELWDIERQKKIAGFNGVTFAHSGPAFNRDQSRILTVDGGNAQLRNVPTGKVLRTFETGQENERLGAAIFSPDEKRILAFGEGATAWLFDAATGQRLRKIVHDRDERS